MSIAQDLINQARHLAKKEPRRPLQASLRRAVSTAYYALFHFLGEETSKLLLGGSPTNKPFRDLAKRAIAHTKLKEVCAEFVKPTPKDLFKPFWSHTCGHDPYRVIGDGDLQLLSTVFRDLQESRHSADYDHGVYFTKVKAIEACDRSSDAMEAWNRLKTQKPEAAKLFATAILLGAGLAGRS
jgi:uncharacterized protein (UPF0332 family)